VPKLAMPPPSVTELLPLKVSPVSVSWAPPGCWQAGVPHAMGPHMAGVGAVELTLETTTAKGRRGVVDERAVGDCGAAADLNAGMAQRCFILDRAAL